MKSLIIVLTILVPSLAYAQPNLFIKGTAPLLREGSEISIFPILPRRFPVNEQAITKTQIHNHQFEFALQVKGAELYYLKGSKGGSRVFLDKGSVEVMVMDSLVRRITVKLSNINEEYNTYNKQLSNDSITIAYGKAKLDYYMYRGNKNADPALVKIKEKKLVELSPLKTQQAKTLCFNWIKEHPKSIINTSILYDEIENIPEDELKSEFATIPADLKNNVWAKELQYRIDSLFIGAKAPVFTQADTSGQQVSLSSFKGKYVLLDFWASWCVPCREENPNVVKAMQQFANKNFTILSISLDDKKENWLKAIKHDNLNWTHLSDLKGWGNSVSVRYYVYSIPGNYLIDPNGKIVAKNLRGDELIPTLSKLIK